MKLPRLLISPLALALLVVAPGLFYAGIATLEANKLMMLVATVVWFAGAPCWMGRKKENAP